MVKDLLAAVGIVAIGLGVYVAVESHNRKEKQRKDVDESFTYRGSEQNAPFYKVMVNFEEPCENIFPQDMVSSISPLPYGEAIDGWWTDRRYNYHGIPKND